MSNISRLILLSILATSVLYSFKSEAQEIVLVASLPEDEQLLLNRQEVRSLFMGGARRYNFKVVALPPEHPARVIFNTKIIGLTEARIQSYWAQMRFSGRKKPPLKVANESKLLEYLQATPNAVGYISADTPIPKGVQVIFRTTN